MKCILLKFCMKLLMSQNRQSWKANEWIYQCCWLTISILVLFFLEEFFKNSIWAMCTKHALWILIYDNYCIQIWMKKTLCFHWITINIIIVTYLPTTFLCHQDNFQPFLESSFGAYSYVFKLIIITAPKYQALCHYIIYMIFKNISTIQAYYLQTELVKCGEGMWGRLLIEQISIISFSPCVCFICVCSITFLYKCFWSKINLLFNKRLTHLFYLIVVYCIIINCLFVLLSLNARF